MAGDTSRSTFRQSKHYSGVRMQQGRVQMDADWNEQLDIGSYLDQVTEFDVIGGCGVPQGDPGFGVTVQNGNLLISKGRAYVDGILCENDQGVLIALPSPTGSTPSQPDLPGVDFTTSDGLFFEPLLTTLGGGSGFSLPPQPGVFGAYLEVWQRDITGLEDPSIREIALGGPDTCTRTKTVWQVKLLRLGDVGSAQTCPVDWNQLIPPSTGQLEARAQPDLGNTNPCAVPAQAGYRSLENHLYRVEIHTPSATGASTFKWSRENASVVAAWTGTDPTNPNKTLLVSTLGRDPVLGFAGGQWVELTDDTRELWGLPGTLVQLANAEITGLGPTLTINTAVNFSDFPLNPKVRRWDEISTASAILTTGAVPLTENTWIDLENGVQVFFVTGGHYNTGDYWLIPARTATTVSQPRVEWPLDSSLNPIPQLATGIRRHYCSLALLQFNNNTWTFLHDCRTLFPPLTGICAKDVCFDNTTCALPNAQNVQEAIDQLCQAGPGGDSGVHIEGVQFRAGGGKVRNDGDVLINFLVEGINIACDSNVFPPTVSRPTCFVTLELPYPTSASDVELWGMPQLGFQPLVLQASVGVDTNKIFWVPALSVKKWFEAQTLFKKLSPFGITRVLARLTLKGNFIWDNSNPGIYLDGDAFGTRAAGATTTDIKFPSGNGKRGGDFEMWFWLVPPASVLVSLAFSPPVVSPGDKPTGTLTLSGPAPVGGAKVTLSAPAASGIAVPSTVTIPGGQTSQAFTATVGGVPLSGDVIVTAQLGTGAPVKSKLTVFVIG